MASEMPETVRLIDEDGILKFPAEQVGTEYVLASTHQRTLEALREAEKALHAYDDAFSRLFSKGLPLHQGGKPINHLYLNEANRLGTAALARIKEATDGR